MQLGEVPIRMAGGRDPFVDLQQLEQVPGDVLAGEGLEHERGGSAAAEGGEALSAGSDGGADFCGDQFGGF